MCLYPKLINNPKYKANKKNGWCPPPVHDERIRKVPIGCTNCMECRKQKQRAWQGRLLEHIKTNKNGKFVTLTFSNESIKKLMDYEKTFTDVDTGRKFKLSLKELEGYELDNEIAKVATRLFLERWRKKYTRSLQHWLITELGHKGTENIHIHGIIWTDEKIDNLQEIWQYGYVWKGYYKNGKLENYVNEKTVNYCIKYTTKIDLQHQKYKAIILTSPGIGSNYTKTYDSKNNKYNGTNTTEYYRTRTGHKINLPIYWRNKIYTEQEREKLWLQKLDKQERWILGVKISVKNGYEAYERELQFAREKNKQLGYGSDEQNWNRHVYERERRIILQQTRIKNAA